MQGKKLHAMKTFNRLVARVWRAWRHKCRKHNMDQVNKFFVIKKTVIILKIEAFV